MLDSAAEELPSAAVLNPEPLWQLEFGSCWQRMSTATSPTITSNPRDFILDMEETSFSSVSSSSEIEVEVETPPVASSSSSSYSSSRSLKKRAMSLDVVGSRRQAAAAAAAKITPARSEARSSPNAPYFPDWEILMLAESMEREAVEEEDDEFVCPPLKDRPVEPILEVPVVTRRRRSLRSSTSVDPQSMSSAKSKKMIEKWYWSYPPPNQDETADFPVKPDAGKS